MADPVFVVSNLTYTTGDGRALDVMPVRVVGGAVAENAVGQPVDVVPVQLAGGDLGIQPSSITVAPNAPIGTVAARLFTTVSGAALTVVSGPFTLNGSNDLILSQAAGQTGTVQTARIKAERSSPFYSVTQDISVTAVQADPGRWMLFGGASVMQASGALTTIAAGGEYTTRIKKVAGPSVAGKRSFIFGVPGVAANQSGTSPQETIVTGNAINLDRVRLRYGGATYDGQVVGSGSSSATIASASKGVLVRFDLPFDWPADTDMQLEITTHGAIGEFRLPGTLLQRERGEKIYGGTSLAEVDALAASGAPSTAALDTGFSGTMPAYPDVCFCVYLGHNGLTKHPAVIGDSLGYGRNTYSVGATDRGAMGAVRTWLDIKDSTRGRIDCGAFVVPGANMARSFQANSSKVWDLLDDVWALSGGGEGKWPFTCILSQHGRNSANASATMLSEFTAYRDRMRTRWGQSLKVTVCTTPPRTKAISATLTSSGTTATATVGSTAHLVTGRYVTIAGATPAAYNGTYAITVTSGTTFTYAFAGGTSPATGTITASDNWTTRGGQAAYDANDTWGGAGVPAWNDALRANANGLHDGCIDIAAVIHDDTYPWTWPGATFSTTLSAQAGTDGVATWSTCQMAAAPAPGMVLSAGPAAVTVNTVSGIGPFTVVDETPQATVAPSGASVLARSTADGVHPYDNVSDFIAANLPQSQKSVLF